MAGLDDEELQEWADEFLRALGYLLVQANMLDSALIDLYWAASNKMRGDVLEDVRGKPSGVLLQLTERAFEARFPSGELRDLFEKLKPELRNAVDVRNQFVHASWAFDDQNEQMHRERLPKAKGAVQEMRRLKVSDVEAAIDIIGGASETIWFELYDRVAEIEPRPRAELLQIDSR